LLAGRWPRDSTTISGRGTRLSQSLSFDAFAPFIDTEPKTFDGRLGAVLTHAWESFTLGLRLSQGLVVSTEFTPEPLDDIPDPPLQPQLETLLSRIAGVFSQQLSRRWTIELTAGAVRAAQLREPSAQYFSPVGIVGARYAFNGIEFSATFEHTVRQSLFIGEAFASDEGRVRLRLPIGRDRPARWSIEGTLGYDHGQVLELDERDDLTGESVPKATNNRLHTAIFDMAGNWRMNDTLEWSLRYQYSQQWIVGSIVAAESFARHLVLLAARFGYPPQRTRRRSPRSRRRMSDGDWQRFYNPAWMEAEPVNTRRQTPNR
jgi:hypothetical protein